MGARRGQELILVARVVLLVRLQPRSRQVGGAEEIEEIERQGKKKRAKSGRLPDFYNLSNTLRTLGAYLNSKDAQLLELHKRPLTVTLLYQNNDGHPHMEDRTLASFFNVFIEMHGKRSRLKG